MGLGNSPGTYCRYGAKRWFSWENVRLGEGGGKVGAKCNINTGT
uniref:Uncharacterized protein n=1 Tax=Tetraselmis sp. GSL018 TaxID=582737 RepID=A0A061SI45_9CHLO